MKNDEWDWAVDKSLYKPSLYSRNIIELGYSSIPKIAISTSQLHKNECKTYQLGSYNMNVKHNHFIYVQQI